jgi:hypothetical protein
MYQSIVSLPNSAPTPVFMHKNYHKQHNTAPTLASMMQGQCEHMRVPHNRQC